MARHNDVDLGFRLFERRLFSVLKLLRHEGVSLQLETLRVSLRSVLGRPLFRRFAFAFAFGRDSGHLDGKWFKVLNCISVFLHRLLW